MCLNEEEKLEVKHISPKVGIEPRNVVSRNMSSKGGDALWCSGGALDNGPRVTGFELCWPHFFFRTQENLSPVAALDPGKKKRVKVRLRNYSTNSQASYSESK